MEKCSNGIRRDIRKKELVEAAAAAREREGAVATTMGTQSNKIGQ
jgi:hypothetical protein